MHHLKIFVQGLFFMAIVAVQAQLTNTGEFSILPGTTVGALANFQNTATGVVQNNGTLSLFGHYENQGTFSFASPVGGSLLFKGTAMQQLTGSGTNTFYTLVLDNPTNAMAFQLATAVTVANSVNFTQGILKSDGFGGSIRLGAAAVATNASGNSYLDGLLQKKGSAAFGFPVGDNSFYRTAAIGTGDDANTVFATHYKLENSNTAHPHNVYRGNIGFINDKEYWVIERSEGASKVAVTLSWNSTTTGESAESADTLEFHVVRWDTAEGAWIDEGGVVNVGNKTVTTTQAIDKFGVFTLAKASTDDTDTDGDGVPDYVENNTMPPTDPNNAANYPDTDDDGVPDYVENNTVPTSNPNDANDFADADNDGYPDYIENVAVDTDGDGVPDYIETHDVPPTNPNDKTDYKDTDGDEVPDYVENNANPPTNTNDANDFTDTDDDGVPDYVETNDSPATNPNEKDDFTDTDGDGVPDYVENHTNPATDPNNKDDFTDTDGDGVPDYIEMNDTPPTDPNNPNDYTDTDGDSVPDYVETNDSPATDPNDKDDITDTDGDGVPDYVETHDNPATDPNNKDDFTDTDGDGVPDYIEMNDNPPTDPNDATDFTDTDGDGVPDYVEINGNPPSDPNSPDGNVDTDGDGVPDYVEMTDNPATDPNDPNDFTDTDGDGVPDYVEDYDTPPTDPNDPNDFTDTDGDGVPDYVEENDDTTSNPNDPNDFTDTDGDGVPDYVEINGNPPSDPNDASDFADADGDGISDYEESYYTKDEIIIENDMVSKKRPSGFFKIINIESFPDNFVKVFNRNGTVVFSVQGYDNAEKAFRGFSDGTTATLFRKDEGLPTGVYYYVINYTQDNITKTKSGYLYVGQ